MKKSNLWLWAFDPKPFQLIAISCILLVSLAICSVGCDPPGGGTNNDPCNDIQYKTVKLTLIKLFGDAKYRKSTYPPPVSPHMWTGNDKSEIVYPEDGLDDEYYCEVEITSPDCKGFEETTLWNTYNDYLNISVAHNISPVIAVHFFEKCGEYYEYSYGEYETEWIWISPPYAHGVPDEIKATRFAYVKKKACS